MDSDKYLTMKLQELFEGKVKNLAIDREYNKQHSPASTLHVQQMKYDVTINGKVWKSFATEPDAMRAANNMYNKNPRLRISVMPK